MAARKSRPSKTEFPSQTDPRAELPFDAFLAAAQKVLGTLSADLLARADASPGVTAALKARWEAEKASRRTADGYEVYRRRVVGQVSAAWLLSVVFVRTLEDRGLVDRNRIAGPGALDSERQFNELAPYLTKRDYLLTVFRELSNLEATRDLFDPNHDLLWKLAPSAEGAGALLDLFRAPNADAPTFRFGQSDTRYLGDLYEWLNGDVREWYGLYQTPRFVEKFILDRTLERSVEEFGLDATTLIDPTCGSGHFLLGAFERLFDHQLRNHPALDVREAVAKALDSVHGVDINPYAVGIARFRLTLAALEMGGWSKIFTAPRLPLHLVVADSLLHRVAAGQTMFGDRVEQSTRAWKGEEFALEEEGAAKAILAKRYAVVVGNPPYITVKDAALRDEYRRLYPRSALRQYSLGAPFTERFFDLARGRGYVGMITANSFMKREFGKRLIEDFLKSVNLELIVNTSGAYIPGHGTPTVLLFGRNERPGTDKVVGVLAKRGEPATPADAEQGLVWRSVADHFSDIGFENEYVSVAELVRTTLERHPWSLGGGGAAELKELLEERAEKRLADVVKEIGRSTHTGEDEAFFMSMDAANRLGIPSDRCVPLVTGEQVRDWSISEDRVSLFPYDARSAEAVPPTTAPERRYYWRLRRTLRDRKDFGQHIEERGLKWFEHSMFFPKRFLQPLSIAFAFVATHNHFVLDRGGKVFKQTAPAIKLPASTTEDDHLALLGYLNSSTACFWMKQVCHNKTNASQKHSTDPARAAYEFATTAIEQLPIPPLSLAPNLVALSRELTELGALRCSLLSERETLRASEGWAEGADVMAWLASVWRRYDEIKRRQLFLQEEIDWAVYRAFGLCTDEEVALPRDAVRASAEPGARPFEHETGYVDGVSLAASRARGESPRAERPTHWTGRIAGLQRSELRLLEDRALKRQWRDTEQNVDQAAYRSLVSHARLRDVVVGQLERTFRDRVDCASAAKLWGALDSSSKTRIAAIGVYLSAVPAEVLVQELSENAVPFLSAHRYTDSGLEKRAVWEQTWELQRREDDGGNVGEVPVPPKYEQSDFADGSYWRLRGKLDVAKERFISYPGCESDEDGASVYGWAGWNDLQQAQALAALYQKRKTEEGWGKDRLTPMLAGIDELVPWIIQWHNEPNEEYGGIRLGTYFREFVDGQCHALGVTLEEVRAWRPGRKAAKAEDLEIEFPEHPLVDLDIDAQAALTALAAAQPEESRLVIARAFTLLFRPKQLAALAPKRAKGAAKEWAARVSKRELPAGLYRRAEQELVASRLMRTEHAGQRLVVKPGDSIELGDLGWWVAEARLALIVARALDERGVEKLTAKLEAEDRQVLLEAVA